MGLFSSKTPNTIDDEKWAGLQRRAREAEAKQRDWLSKQAAEHRKAAAEQRAKRGLS